MPSQWTPAYFSSIYLKCMFLSKPATSDATRQDPQGKRKIRRPVENLEKVREEEPKEANITWNTAKRTAAKRVRVKMYTYSATPHWGFSGPM